MEDDCCCVCPSCPIILPHCDPLETQAQYCVGVGHFGDLFAWPTWQIREVATFGGGERRCVPLGMTIPRLTLEGAWIA